MLYSGIDVDEKARLRYVLCVEMKRFLMGINVLYVGQILSIFVIIRSTVITEIPLELVTPCCPGMHDIVLIAAGNHRIMSMVI